MTTLKQLDVDIEVQPLEQWPRGYERTPAKEREASRFESKGILDRTLDDLERELRMLGAEDVVLQVDVNPNAIRRDGLPYQNAKIAAEDSGVVLTFDADGDTHTYPCDTYVEWTENLRAIVLALESLRRVTRYGVGHGSEQYRGYTALPEDVDERVGPREAARILVSTAGYSQVDDFDQRVEKVLGFEGEARSYLREAQARAHPDKATGNPASFKRVQRAADVLGQHHAKKDEAITGT